jgi:hypothetical protein
VRIANRRDDLWVEVKCQANSEIAGSPRNAFRCSLVGQATAAVAWLDRRGGLPLTDPNQTANAAAVLHRSETAGAKFRRREGNSPDRRLRSLSPDSVAKVVPVHRQPGGWLRSSHP